MSRNERFILSGNVDTDGESGVISSCRYRNTISTITLYSLFVMLITVELSIVNAHSAYLFL